MSGSPKYTTADISAAYADQIAAQQRQREYERQQQLERERLQRVAAWRYALEQRQAAALGRAIGLAAAAASVDAGPQQQAAAAATVDLAAAITRATAEAELAGLDRRLTELEQNIDALGLTVSAQIALREREGALATLRRAVEQEEDRQHLDPGGYAEVARLIMAAEQAVADPRAYPERHRVLADGIARHLQAVRQRAQELAHMRRAADEVTGRANALLHEAATAGADIAGRDRLAGLVARLAERVAAEDTAEVGRLAADVRVTSTAFSGEFDSWQAEQDRTEIIVRALAKALPAAGLRVVAGSLVTVGSGARLAAEQSDGSQIDIAVLPQDGGTARIEYRAPGRDFVTETTAGGEVAVCDVTEQVLETLHTQLAAQDVATDGLHWERKPRPDQRAAKDSRARTSESRTV